MGSTTRIRAAISNNPTRGERDDALREPPYGAFTLYDAPFEATSGVPRRARPAIRKLQFDAPRGNADSVLSSARFIRHY